MQYIVAVHDLDERKSFYNYILEKYNLNDLVNDNSLKSVFPFVVDFDKNQLWVCSSIACLAAAAHLGKIITIDEFKERTNQKELKK